MMDYVKQNVKTRQQGVSGTLNGLIWSVHTTYSISAILNTAKWSVARKAVLFVERSRQDWKRRISPFVLMLPGNSTGD